MGSSHPNLLYTASPSHFFYTVPAFFLYFLLLLLFILLFTLSILFTVGKTSRQKDSTLQNTQVPTQQKDNENATYSTPPNSLVLSCLTHTHTERTYDKISHAKKKKQKRATHTHKHAHNQNTTTEMSPTYTMSAHLCRQFYTSWNQSRRQTASTEAVKPAAPPSASSPSKLLPSHSPTHEKIIPERRGSTSSNSSSSSSLSTSPSRH